MLKIRVDRLDAARLARDLRTAVDRSQGDIAAKIRKLHKLMLGSGGSPNAEGQKANSPAWTRRKGGLPPLVFTGRFQNNLATKKIPGGRVVAPPSDRTAIVERLHADGYRTVFQELPDTLDDEAQDLVNQRVDQVDLARYIKPRWFGGRR